MKCLSNAFYYILILVVFNLKEMTKEQLYIKSVNFVNKLKNDSPSSVLSVFALLCVYSLLLSNVYRDIKFLLEMFQPWLHIKVVVGWRRMVLVFVFSSD